ncbi:MULTISPECIES: hypothetical protein [unclassified Halomonas]|nr:MULTISPECIES: hypothetical protein [unclassified Halomonas]
MTEFMFGAFTMFCAIALAAVFAALFYLCRCPESGIEDAND